MFRIGEQVQVDMTGVQLSSPTARVGFGQGPGVSAWVSGTVVDSVGGIYTVRLFGAFAGVDTVEVSAARLRRVAA